MMFLEWGSNGVPCRLDYDIGLGMLFFEVIEGRFIFGSAC